MVFCFLLSNYLESSTSISGAQEWAQDKKQYIFVCQISKFELGNVSQVSDHKNVLAIYK